ncbi:MAG TPA: FAD-dependent oxidoreductase [Candidatus Aphodomonas merdavium]|nr:FAD-dependent oxidoreductase [Candidatus Aphodomonas merdavium]
MTDLLIIGGGPAGLTAALYALRAGKSARIVEKNSFGGQIATSPKVENYPGVSAAPGAEIADTMLSQTLALGCEVEIGEIVSVEKIQNGFRAFTSEGERYEGRTLVLCPGVAHRKLGVPGEEALAGNGVCYCAVCDGDFYRGRDVVLVGGGNSALQEAMLLSDICRRLTIVQNLDDFTGEAPLAQAVKRRDNVRVFFGCTVTRLLETNGALTGCEILRESTGATETLQADGLFVSIGLLPQNAPFAALAALDDAGYFASDERCLTHTPGVFVAGDCRAKSVRQLTTAVADGASAALAALRYLRLAESHA